MRKAIIFASGFLALFLLYHLPEAFQQYYQRPFLWLLEAGMLVVILVAYLIMRLQGRTGFASMGLPMQMRYGSNLLKGLLIGIALTSLANLTTVWLHWNTLSTPRSISGILGQSAIFVVGTLLPSVAEDLLTRGYLYAYWPAGAGKNRFVMLSAGVFTLNHIFRLNHADVLVYLFILGLLLAWCLAYTGSLWLTVGIHWGTNIAYQFFTNVVSLTTLRATGLDNYVLAACYLIGSVVVVALYQKGAFHRQDTLSRQ